MYLPKRWHIVKYHLLPHTPPSIRSILCSPCLLRLISMPDKASGSAGCVIFLATVEATPPAISSLLPGLFLCSRREMSSKMFPESPLLWLWQPSPAIQPVRSTIIYYDVLVICSELSDTYITLGLSPGSDSLINVIRLSMGSLGATQYFFLSSRIMTSTLFDIS